MRHTCSDCGGHGVIKCPICDGKGKIYRITSTDAGQSVCAKCRGLGDINCHSCKGYGDVNRYPNLVIFAKTAFKFNNSNMLQER